MTLRNSLILGIIAAPLVLGGCSNMSHTQQTTLSGGAIGTGVGAVGAALTGGSTVAGAALGGAVGAAAGYIKGETDQR